MGIDVIANVLRQVVWTIIIVASPVLIVSMVVGLIVSIFQATTSIQDQTLTFVPKILAIFGALVVFGPFMAETVNETTMMIFGLIAEVN